MEELASAPSVDPDADSVTATAARASPAEEWKITVLLARAGVPVVLARRWAATGVVDPDLIERIAYLVEGRKYEHWIQARLVTSGVLRYSGDPPFLTVEEVLIWHRLGWDPEAAAAEFRGRHRRRPWEELHDVANDHTGEHRRKRWVGEPAWRNDTVLHVTPLLGAREDRLDDVDAVVAELRDRRAVTATLPTARQALARFGLTDAQIEDRLLFAMTGRFLDPGHAT